ncbi:MAG: M15 family metallopeptidase [Candidatus Kapaibacterium sp.]
MFGKLFGLILAAFMMAGMAPSGNAIIDSDMTFQQAIAGTNAPQSIIDSLRLIDVEYYSFDGRLHRGQLVVNIAVEQDINEIFKLIKKIKFPVEKVIPIVAYEWSDDASMEDNNTSAFNYRFIAGTQRLSNHATGRAIDINPFQNPAIYSDGKISPNGAEFDPDAPGTLISDHPVTKAFLGRGWRWGGDWTSLKDYQHFDRP